MANYSRLAPILAKATQRNLADLVVPALIDIWLDDYLAANKADQIVETTSANFSYLFDIGNGRLIAAWGVSQGRHGEKRPAARMAGHPLSAGPHYHRGHAIPHTLGGPTDINLVPQRGSINIGPFRVLEKQAVRTPGAIYFTYWVYPDNSSQTPASVDQGLLVAGTPPRISNHSN